MKWIKIPNTNEEIAEDLETNQYGQVLTNISWYEATEYCKAKNCRLPTFAEVELVEIPKNFYEWTSDSSIKYPGSKIVRGSSQSFIRDSAACSLRLYEHPLIRSIVGFRCVRKQETIK